MTSRQKAPAAAMNLTEAANDDEFKEMDVGGEGESENPAASLDHPYPALPRSSAAPAHGRRSGAR